MRGDPRHGVTDATAASTREENDVKKSRNPLVGELCAEFAGTLILMLIGTAVVAQVVTSADGSLGDHDSIAWAWGIAVTLGSTSAPGSPAATSTPRSRSRSRHSRVFRGQDHAVYPGPAAGAFVAHCVRATYTD